jgi:predicted metal-dependent phosphoesterase TrpH
MAYTSDWACTDVHMHSHHSDGQLSPHQLMHFMSTQGIRCAALTDHDTLAGLDEAQRAAAELHMQFIPGIELSCEWLGRTLHVLGLHIDAQHPALISLSAELLELRLRRVKAYLKRLQAVGIDLSLNLSPAPTRAWTRTHLAEALVQQGHASQLKSAFKRFLGSNGCAYVPTSWPTLARIVRCIGDAGGLAVLAHPLRYTLSSGQRRQLLREFQDLGGCGLEVISGGMAPKDQETTRGLALRSGLKVTRGSDCHNPQNPWHQPSRLAKLHPSLSPLWPTIPLIGASHVR